MKCTKCGFEFDEGIFCPECGTKNEPKKVKTGEEFLEKKGEVDREREERGRAKRETQEREASERLQKTKIEQARLAKEKAEAEERLAREKKEQERLLKEKTQLEARTYQGIVYADEQEARLANEENGTINALKEQLIPVKSQNDRRKILSEFDSKEIIHTVEAKKRYELLKVKINQDKPKALLYNMIYGISVILAIIITMIMGTMGIVENVFFFIVAMWYGIGIPVWIIWKIVLIIKSKGKNYYLYIKDI